MCECKLYHNFARDFGAALVVPERWIKKDSRLHHYYSELIQDLEDLKKVKDRAQASVTFFCVEMDFDNILHCQYYCDNYRYLLSLIKDMKIRELF